MGFKRKSKEFNVKRKPSGGHQNFTCDGDVMENLQTQTQIYPKQTLNCPDRESNLEPPDHPITASAPRPRRL